MQQIHNKAKHHSLYIYFITTQYFTKQGKKTSIVEEKNEAHVLI